MLPEVPWLCVLTYEFEVVGEEDEVFEQSVQVSLLPEFAHLIEVRVINMSVHSEQSSKYFANCIYKVRWKRLAVCNRKNPLVI